MRAGLCEKRSSAEDKYEEKHKPSNPEEAPRLSLHMPRSRSMFTIDKLW